MTTDQESPLLLTVAEACERLAISRPTFYGLVHAGTLRTIKIGRSRRVPSSCLDEFVERQLLSQDQKLNGPSDAA